MKTLLFVFATLLLLSECRFPSTPIVKDNDGTDNQKSQSIDPSIFTLAQAEMILGEPAKMVESIVRDSIPHSTYNATYKAVGRDSITSDTGTIYVMFDIFPELDSAKMAYNKIYSENLDHSGLRPLTDLGDEAYIHSDSTNFYFILSRKGNKMVRMKVNRITSHTSVDALQKVTKQIVDAM